MDAINELLFILILALILGSITRGVSSLIVFTLICFVWVKLVMLLVIRFL